VPQPRARALLACLVLALAACAGEPPAASRDTNLAPAEPAPRQETPMPTDGDLALPPERLLAPVLADASKRTGMPTEELVVTNAWRRTWNDGSLGCPQPGMNYTQALVPGWQVIVAAGERSLDYHLSDRGSFIVCAGGGVAGADDLRVER
jgi:hypothetical protein